MSNSHVWLLGIAMLVLAMFTLSGAADDPAKPKTDLDRLGGSWQVVLRERNGKLTETGVMITSIDGDKLQTTDGSGKLLEVGTIVLDEKANPKTYDVKITGGFENKGHIYRGIYRIQGDTWQICVNADPKGDRPKKFYSKPQTTHQMLVFRRLGSLVIKLPNK